MNQDTIEPTMMTQDVYEVNYSMTSPTMFVVVVDDVHFDVDLQRQTLRMNKPIRADVLYAACKSIWRQDETVLQYTFPFEAMSDKHIAMNPEWMFADFTSRKCVTPPILEFMPVKPEPPAAPQTVVTHPPQVFDPGVSLEELLEHVPQDVNLKSTRVYARRDGRIQLECPGQWKNMRIKRDTKAYKDKMDDYNADVTRYRERVVLWNETHPDNRITLKNTD